MSHWHWSGCFIALQMRLVFIDLFYVYSSTQISNIPHLSVGPKFTPVCTPVEADCWLWAAVQLIIKVLIHFMSCIV